MYLRDLILGQSIADYVFEHEYLQNDDNSKHKISVRKPFLIHTHNLNDLELDIDYNDVSVFYSLRRNISEYLGSHIFADAIDRFTYRTMDALEPLSINSICFDEKSIVEHIHRMEVFLRSAVYNGHRVLWYEDWVDNLEALEQYGLTVSDINTTIVKTPHNKWDYIDVSELKNVSVSVKKRYQHYLLWKFVMI